MGGRDEFNVPSPWPRPLTPPLARHAERLALRMGIAHLPY
jgi:hypothetical protein